MRQRLGGLWLNADFLKFWTGETISLFGTGITEFALPFVAILTLGASAAQMGLLQTARVLPALLVTLFAGVVVDRWLRRRIMIGANLARALLIGSVPALAVTGALRIDHLYVIGFLLGTLQILFDLAYQSYVPSLVERENLVEGNSKLQLSASAAQIGAPGLGGVLVQALTAPLALLVNSASFVASAVGVLLIRKPEPAPQRAAARAPLWHEIGDGLRVVVGNPYIRALAGAAATYNLFIVGILALYQLYATRQLGIAPRALGVIIGLGSIGALLGSLAAGPVQRRFGLGPGIVGAAVVTCLAPILIPLAGLVGGPAAGVFLGASQFVTGVGLFVHQIYSYSLRQAITAERLLGRMNAAYRFFIVGVAPIGPLAAGALGERIGLQATMLLFAVGTWLALPWFLLSPVPGLRKLPERAGEAVVRGDTAAGAPAPSG